MRRQGQFAGDRPSLTQFSLDAYVDSNAFLETGQF